MSAKPAEESVTLFQHLRSGLKPGNQEVGYGREQRCQQSNQRTDAEAEDLRPELEAKLAGTRLVTWLSVASRCICA